MDAQHDQRAEQNADHSEEEMTAKRIKNAVAKRTNRPACEQFIVNWPGFIMEFVHQYARSCSQATR